jgi:CrcB protein
VTDDPDADPVELPIDPELDRADPAEPSVTHHPQRGGAPSRLRPDVLLSTALGGALGATARYTMIRLVPVGSNGFPWATFSVNLSGSLVLGIIAVLVAEHLPPTRFLRPFVIVGFLGAYTTYSTYMVETDLLVRHGHTAVAATYVLGSAAAGFLLVWVGILIGRLLPVWHPSAADAGRASR